MRLLIMGAPGAGKGTQAHSIGARFGIPAISTGSIFRDSVAHGTPLGQQIESLLASGDLVPDSVTEQVVAERLSESDAADGWILDGFPRTLPQLDSLDRHLAEHGQSLDAVISLQVRIDALTTRLVRRGQIEGRTDDNQETISRRMQNYVDATQPLLDTYRERGLLLEIDGGGRIADVTARITEELDKISAASSAD